MENNQTRRGKIWKIISAEKHRVEVPPTTKCGFSNKINGKRREKKSVKESNAFRAFSAIFFCALEKFFYPRESLNTKIHVREIVKFSIEFALRFNS